MARRPGTRPTPPPQLPHVHLARDHDRSVVAKHLRDGSWVQVRPGAAIDAALVQGPDSSRLLALAHIAALREQLAVGFVASHVTAALLWGLPTERTPTTTHLIEPGRARPEASPGVVRHRHELGPDDVTVVHGLRVTTLERTLVDCAMSEPAPAGMVIADAALHRGADRRLCERLLARMVGRRGVVRGRAVVEWADDGAESAAESLVRVALLAAGFPPPQTQVAVMTELGVFWGDLGWPERRLLIEYDGRAKYDDAPTEVMMAEKRREDALLDAGWRLLRLTVEDLRDLDRLVRRVRRLLPGPLTPRPLLTRY